MDANLTQVIENIRNNPAALQAEIQKQLEKKNNIESKLARLERQIYNLEGSYMSDNKSMGNILTGWDSFLLSRGGSGALRRTQKFKESDRLFSSSSVSSRVALATAQPNPSSTTTTTTTTTTTAPPTNLNNIESPAQKTVHSQSGKVLKTEENDGSGSEDDMYKPNKKKRKAGPGRPRKDSTPAPYPIKSKFDEATEP